MKNIHLYYGYGKGKTTAVIGLAIRALGAGQRVAMVQFDKGYDGQNEHYSERNILRKLASLGYPVKLFPTGCERMNADGTFRFGNQGQDLMEAKRALEKSKELIENGALDLLILDEGLAATAYHLIQKEDLMAVIELYEQQNRPCELVISGHKIWPEIEAKADLITEMRKVKHYFDEGVPARLGIEF
ncbi:ATP:corrinoid adenosyltransferase BtuR/CobO/CobP [Chloroherpeton thalassium ATCC 35110]|uniref:corrinoid adenosyltransferase n=1 Tax=Chloroherpeton thalassium (strain ATCC 35110 / GB-78) TaxID=517418 RepID=B3QVH1_CHLT3|nr:cob(I)yrinic acid a,c-diamide adenosyltransferase [Chloroherpeton thalassium]ACF14571.1 ATP:corrinoid adenosyltransferase BtuR/CobO/CobP [Chloroherpeton thalassium ATCC 35110]